MVEPFHTPIALFASFFGLLLGIVGLAATIYALYDILVVQKDMESIEKLIWILVVLFFNIFGVLIYFLIVKVAGERPFSDISWFQEDRKISELERLADLKDRGAISEEEYEKEKEKLLGEDQ